MSATWKPGDVAMVPGVGRALLRDSGQWVTQSNKHRWSLPGFAGFNNVTPLAVVDPEDMEEVERVRDALWRGGTLEQWQEGLRALANPKPPKPEEPTGLGAVVESVNGDLWVRIDSDGVWACASDEDKTATYWSAIAAVCVLSEGVQP